MDTVAIDTVTVRFVEHAPRERLQAHLDAWCARVYPGGAGAPCRLLLPWPLLVSDPIRVRPAAVARVAPLIEVARSGGADPGNADAPKEVEQLDIAGRLPGLAIASLSCPPGTSSQPGAREATAALGRALQAVFDQRVAALLPLLRWVDARDTPAVLAQHLRLLLGGDPDQYKIHSSSDAPPTFEVAADGDSRWFIRLPVGGLAWTFEVQAGPEQAPALDAVRSMLLVAGPGASQASEALDGVALRWGPAQVLEHDLRRRLEYLPLPSMAAAARKVLDLDFPTEQRTRAAEQLADSILAALPALRGLRGFLEAISALGHRADGTLDPGWLDPDRYPLASWPDSLTDERWSKDREYEPWLFAIKQFTDHPDFIVAQFTPEARRRPNDRVLARLPPFVTDDADRVLVSSAAGYFFLAPAVESTRNAIRYLTTAGTRLPKARVRVDLSRGWCIRFEIENQVDPRKRFVLSHTIIEMAHLFRRFPGLRLEVCEPSKATPFFIRYEIDLRGLKFRE